MTQPQKQNQSKKQGSKAPALRGAVDQALNRIKELKNWNALQVPPNYSPENAIRSASFIIADLKTKDEKPVTEACTKSSIQNALLDMVIQGLSPMKQQCSFVPYGKQLKLVRQWPGTIALAKRFGGVKEVVPVVIYQGDDFKYEIDPKTGYQNIVKHEQDFDNIDPNNVRGAYALVHHKGSNEPYVEIMTIKQIKDAWNQGAMKGNSPAHNTFTDEMAKKTVINRACKRFINSSDDAPIITEQEPKDRVKESTEEEIAENANAEQMTDWEEAEEGDAEQEQLDVNQHDGTNTQQTPEGDAETDEPSEEKGPGF